MRTRLLLPAAALVVALAAAGCGGNDNNKSGSNGPAGGNPASGKGPVTIQMRNIQFSPRSVTVAAGTQVTWINEDNVDHNVKADTNATFKSDDFGKGGTYQFTPETKGTITYECTLHPGMTATLKVV